MRPIPDLIALCDLNLYILRLLTVPVCFGGSISNQVRTPFIYMHVRNPSTRVF